MCNDTPHDETSRTNAAHEFDGIAADPAFAKTAALVDCLAQAERDEPDAGFESRLIAVAKPGVAGRIGGDAPRSRRVLAARSWWMLPVAAALVLGVLWVRSGPPSGMTPGAGGDDPVLTLAAVEADLETFLFVDEFGDDRTGVATASGAGLDNGVSASDSNDTADAWLYELLNDNGESL